MHGGGGPDPSTGAVNTPVYLSSTFNQDAVGTTAATTTPVRATRPGPASRPTSPLLEGAAFGFAFASGMAAEDAVLRLLGPGDHLVIPDRRYGGTYRLATQVHQPPPASPSTPPTLPPSERRRGPSTRMVWVETPTNPLLDVIDIAAVAELAHRRGALVVVDNTFATPWLQRPLALGADIVVHSTTKYLGGHSDVVGVFAATATRDWPTGSASSRTRPVRSPGPFDCFFVQRGVKTLPIRMERHCANALAVVELLRSPSRPSRGAPSLARRPSRPRVAARQMRAFGGWSASALHGGEQAALRCAPGPASSPWPRAWVAVESLIEHPGRMTHASAAGSRNEVPGDLVRLSVGLETVDDLVDDLRRALDTVV